MHDCELVRGPVSTASRSYERGESLLRETWGIACGETSPDVDAPEALMEVRGEDISEGLKADWVRVVQQLPVDRIP
jgi:hypothetical protein